MDEFEARAVASTISKAAPFLTTRVVRIEHDDENQRNVMVELDDYTGLLVQKEVRWSVSVVTVDTGRIEPPYVSEPTVAPTDTDGIAREALELARQFYFGDFGMVSGVADPFGRRDQLEAAIKGLEG
ncbi:hypothetical protein [Curtobacterium flaccumfaciens]|uniref:hypothetical protein n=1 Tax=Curtobacterium flaccumfaciens TaxID=2035 RepID=UPI001266DF89|nr:hypothetical protein [Curtobacterium flaccumfaciens]MBT1664937.1 hypothetical protein [Curtobacterium flaccumfaciens pv. flaccumfaciens]QFS79403.1 hypothetical protein GBG65_07915 [Curtobacterium flaccumfaciens pv. flaccumfaciens]